MSSLGQAVKDMLDIVVGSVLAGITASFVLRRLRLKWTWALLALPVGLRLVTDSLVVGAIVTFASVIACGVGWSGHHYDLHLGADFALEAESRTGLRDALIRLSRRMHRRRHGWIRHGWVEIGRDVRGRPVSIPAGDTSGSHTLVLGATGSGKTVSTTWVAARLVEHGHAGIVIDPKGDPLLHDQLQTAAERRGVPFLKWTPEGPCSYNPYAHGGDSEIADKALAGEQFTEPHYLRQAQRYLGHAIRTLHTTNTPITTMTLTEHLDPRQLDATARQLPDPHATRVQQYLDALTDRQKRDLAGVRDRLSILAESDINHWLNPQPHTPLIDLHATIHNGAVVYFRLDADRRPLISQMLAAAIISDLVTLTATLQTRPVPTVVVIDEFAAIAAEHVARLFGRARSAGVSLILATQELADMKTASENLREQVLGNIAALIAHRQNIPESAELIAGIAGTRPAWVTTEQTQDQLLLNTRSGRGTRRRGYEYTLHPDRIKTLPTGYAAVITPGHRQRATIARIHHPNEAQP